MRSSYSEGSRVLTLTPVTCEAVRREVELFIYLLIGLNVILVEVSVFIFAADCSSVTKLDGRT